MTGPLFVSLADDSWQRAHYALIVAAGALTLGRDVTIFAGGRSVLAFSAEWSRLEGCLPDKELATRNIPGFEELRDAIISLGASILVCETGLALAGLDTRSLCNTASVCGIITFLERVGSHQIMSL